MRASPPPVTVLTNSDFWLTELRAGRCFGRGFRTIIPAAGNVAEVQLFNPVGSGVQASVYYCHGTTPEGALDVRMRRFNTQLATLVGAGVNLLSGGAAGQAVVRTNTPLAPGDGTDEEFYFTGQNNSQGQLAFWRIELSPGQGVLFATINNTGSLLADFLWREGA